VTHTHALFAEQSQSIPNNLVASSGHAMPMAFTGLDMHDIAYVDLPPPRPIRRWGTSRSQPSAVKPHTDSPALPGLAYDGRYRLSRAWQTGVAAVRPECQSGSQAPTSPDPIQPASRGRAAW
jgi:hypothetical protein